MNWKIGDRAVILRSLVPERVGLIVTVLSEPSIYSPYNGVPWSDGCKGVLIDLPYPGLPECHSCYPPEWLGPIPDANEKTTWDESIFMPKVLERCEP